MLLSSIGSGRKVALVIALAVVACAAIFGGVASVRYSLNQASAPPPDKDEMTFMCDECEAVFTRLTKDLPAGFLEDAMAGKRAAIDCPKCGAKDCAYLPQQCPNCGKYYLTDQCRGLPPSDEPDSDRCPHCGTSAYEWYLKNVKPDI